VKVIAPFGPRPTVAGSLLTSARIRTGLSQRELAEKAGVAHSTVARIEAGHMDPSFGTLARILASVGLEVRTQLATLDDHDQVLSERQAQRTSEEQAEVAAAHERNVAKFVEGGRQAGLHAKRARDGRAPATRR
jgi:transcriptional regulator with XRE-family HTH domain